MSVEIRELVMKATVYEDEYSDSSKNRPEIDESALVAECVEKVLKILEDKKDR